MAQSGNGEIKTRDEIIAEVRELQTTLESLGVKRERIIVHSLKTAELEDLATTVREQLEQRKNFLGKNYEQKNQ